MRSDHPLEIKEETIVLPGHVVGDQIYVWCYFCNRYHIHGWKGESPDAVTHRVPHCGWASPYPCGYYVKEVTRRARYHKGDRIHYKEQWRIMDDFKKYHDERYPLYRKQIKGLFEDAQPIAKNLLERAPYAP